MHTFLFADEVKVGVYNFEPLSNYEASEDGNSFFTDIIKYTAEKENWELQFRPGSINNGYQNLETNTIDILVAVPHIKENMDKYQFSKETIVSTWAEIYSSRDFNILSVLDLDDFFVGMVQDDPYNKTLKNMINGMR